MGLLLKVKTEKEETRTTFQQTFASTPSAPTLPVHQPGQEKTIFDGLVFTLLEEQTIDTLLRGGGRPKLRANDGGDAFSRARRRVLVGWKAGSAKVVEIDF